MANRPWDALKCQIYLGSDEFIERHSRRTNQINEIPRAQLKAIKPTLERIFAKIETPGLPKRTEAWVPPARDRCALGSPLRDGEPKTQTNRAADIIVSDCKT
jgi:hypothetical protein